jgi:hypothetical protein
MEKTLNNMSKEELKEAQNSIKKDMRQSQRDMDRAIFRAEFEIKQQRTKLEKMIKKGESRALCKQYASNVLSAQNNRDRLLVNKTKIQDTQFTLDNMFAQVKMAGAMGDVSKIVGNVNKMMNISEITSTAASLQMNLAKVNFLRSKKILKKILDGNC